jgi:hypothetical protein
MGDTLALKPFTRTSSANRSAFSWLENTPNCTAQPDSGFEAADGLLGFAVDELDASADEAAFGAFKGFEWTGALAAGLGSGSGA